MTAARWLLSWLAGWFWLALSSVASAAGQLALAIHSLTSWRAVQRPAFLAGIAAVRAAAWLAGAAVACAGEASEAAGEL